MDGAGAGERDASEWIDDARWCPPPPPLPPAWRCCCEGVVGRDGGREPGESTLCSSDDEAALRPPWGVPGREGGAKAEGEANVDEPGCETEN